MFRVESGDTATIKNIVIDGNPGESPDANRSLINVKGTLNITTGTVLRNNKIGSSAARRIGGAISADGGIINMDAGSIDNNSATFGGGIVLNNNAIMNMSGGTIQNNQAINGPYMLNDAASGGAICASSGGTINLSGNALIQNNYSDEVGGGISVGTLNVSLQDNRLNMYGGTIDNNSSGSTGGGIFIQAEYGTAQSIAKITQGSITNNNMLGTGKSPSTFGGGAIYVNGYDSPGFDNGELYLENAVITENTAVRQGGGYASCPISNTKIYLNNGGAFYNNKSDELADEIYIYSHGGSAWGVHAGYPEYTISETMLGGVAYNWKYSSDGTEVPLNTLHGQLTEDGIYLALYTDAIASTYTDSLAKVFIVGNRSATKGGGIGSNGNVTIGTSSETVDILVSKQWDDQNNVLETRPDFVEVQLWRTTSGSDEQAIYVGHEIIAPDVDGNWITDFSNLAKFDALGNLYEYHVKEIDVEGYVASVIMGEDGSFTITNSISTEIPISKIWADAENQDGLRPENVTIKLLADGELTGDELVLAESNNWTDSFTGLPKYKAGIEIEYSVEEMGIGDGYLSTIEGDQEEGFTVTNSRVPEKIEVPASKIWADGENQDGLRPENVTIKLLADGELTGDELVLAESNNWTDSFTGLPKYKAGQVITYTIAEDEVEGYTSEIDGNQEIGFKVTNSRTPEKPLIPTDPSRPKEDTPTTSISEPTPTPKTGEVRSIQTLLGLILLLTGGVLIVLRRKNKQN